MGCNSTPLFIIIFLLCINTERYKNTYTCNKKLSFHKIDHLNLTTKTPLVFTNGILLIKSFSKTKNAC